jgi:hypothetical protein
MKSPEAPGKNAHGRLMGKLNNKYLVFCNRKTKKNRFNNLPQFVFLVWLCFFLFFEVCHTGKHKHSEVKSIGSGNSNPQGGPIES